MTDEHRELLGQFNDYVEDVKHFIQLVDEFGTPEDLTSVLKSLLHVDDEERVHVTDWLEELASRFERHLPATSGYWARH